MKRRYVRPNAPRDERGATVALLGVVLVVLMIFAAFSVDIGTAYAQKRQNQGSVDTAALAGGVHFLTTGRYDQAIADVKARVADDMGTKISDADWAACTDSGALPVSSLTYTATEGSPCISFGRNEDTDTLQMRVRLPDVESRTAFASVIGIDQLNTHAVAVVNIGSPLGGAFPAYVLSGVAPGSVVCILNAPGGQNTPCNTSDSGQFGTFAPWYYAPAAGCAEGNQGGGNYYSQAPAIANGLDHLLAAYTGFNSDPGLVQQRINGGGGCTVMGPNTLNNSTGYSNQTITTGMVTGDPGAGGPPYEGRLVGGPYSDGDGGILNTARIADELIDNVPAWAFLIDFSAMPISAPLECKVATQLPVKRDVAAARALQLSNGLSVGGAPLYPTPEELLAGCLGKWTPAVGEIFTRDFAKSRRAIAVPRYWEDTLGSASTNYHIRDFVPAFLTGEFQKDGTTHWSGDEIPANGKLYNDWNRGSMKNLIQGVAAMYVPCGSLPDNICRSPEVPGDSGLGGVVHGVTLAK